MIVPDRAFDTASGSTYVIGLEIVVEPLELRPGQVGSNAGVSSERWYARQAARGPACRSSRAGGEWRRLAFCPVLEVGESAMLVWDPEETALLAGSPDHALPATLTSAVREIRTLS